MTSPTPSQPMNGHTSGPWTVSDVRSVEGEYLVVGGAGQDFGLIASCPEKSDAELIASVPTLKARIEELTAALEAAIHVAGEARAEWDKAPSGMRAGKLLIALSDPSLKYREDISAMHAARATLASKGGVK